MSERQSTTEQLTDSVCGQANIIWDLLDRFVQEYGNMVLRREVLPPEAARDLAKILEWSRELKNSASALNLELTQAAAEERYIPPQT